MKIMEKQNKNTEARILTLHISANFRKALEAKADEFKTDKVKLIQHMLCDVMMHRDILERLQIKFVANNRIELWLSQEPQKLDEDLQASIKTDQFLKQ